ncbi:sensor domain-containing diguanylate cyclase [Oxalobacteraceae bacterium CAVE-383]|nr:sensor domain-containing diguanylate cyclase [Oxalobacteraceae bacterium CAVE-383]
MMDRDQLLEDHEQLQAAFQDLLEQARINQQIMQRHQAFDIRLLDADGFPDLLDILLNGMLESFDLQSNNLFLYDTKHDIRHILSQLKVHPEQIPRLHFLDYREQLGPDLATLRKPALAAYDAVRHQGFFPGETPPASVAVLPLLRQHEPIGFLALGSAVAKRFSAHLATDFIERLASFIAICIENVINNERLKQVGLTDPLTGVSNRRYIEQRLLAELNQAQRQQSQLSCLYIDIDFFKKINDSVGHQAGDEVLCEVANRIKQHLRINDALARFGGEEFIVLLMQTGHAAALQIAERIRGGIASQPIAYKGASKSGSGKLHSSVSIGVATVEPSMRDAAPALMHQLIAQSDKALYQAKQNGRNRVVSDTQLKG